MVEILLRENEGCAPDPSLLWDSVWLPNEGVADWRLAGAAPLNAGGLAATAELQTAVILALFSDLRCPADHPVAFLMDGDPRGWWGDGIDVRAGEAPLGSLLWLLERAPMMIRGLSVGTWAEQFARDALAGLITQGAIARVDVSAVVNAKASRLELTVNLYGRDGTAVYQDRFELLWRQLFLGQT